jgi:hypothetical protein
MSELDRLKKFFEGGSLVDPSKNDLNLVDLAENIFANLHAKAGTTPPSIETRSIPSLQLNGKHLIFVLIDGMGTRFINQLGENDFLRKKSHLEINSVVPSATTAAITALGTGVSPSKHGAPGWWTVVPERNDHIIPLPYIQTGTNKKVEHSTDDIFFTKSRFYEFKNQNNLSLEFHYPKKINNSTYSRFYSADYKNVPYDSFAEAVDNAASAIKNSKSEFTFTSIYYSDLDSDSHMYGVDSKQVSETLQYVQQNLRRLTEAVSNDVDIVVTADHGQINVDKDRSLAIFPDDDIYKLLRLRPSGEPRMPIFHTKDGCAETFKKQFLSKHSDAFCLLTPNECESIDLMGVGPYSEAFKKRLGDFVGVGINKSIFEYFPSPARFDPLRGQHGGLEPEEMKIPVYLWS